MADRKLVEKLLSLIAPKEREKKHFETILRKMLYSLYLESKYAEVIEMLDFDVMYEKYIDTYVRSLDDETVSALIKFCQSEAGIQWILNIPIINSQIEFIKGDFVKDVTKKIMDDNMGLPQDIDPFAPPFPPPATSGGDIN